MQRPPRLVTKVYAFIVHRGRLALFQHVDRPAVRVQVPGGTVEAGESLADAVLREAQEESGLSGLALVAEIGQQTAFFTDDNGVIEHHRHFFHLSVAGEPPEAWEHWELYASDGSAPMRFAFFWAVIPDEVPPLFDEADPALRHYLQRCTGRTLSEVAH